MNNAKLLIIEDEVALAKDLRGAFGTHGITATLAHDGACGLELALGEKFDLILLDLGLPKIPGPAVLQAIRERRPDQPILILSARDKVEGRISGLDLGADDYLAKPFSFNELLARVRAILRRGNTAKTTLQLADLTLDLVRHTVTRSGRDISLTPNEFALLRLLMLNVGNTVPRQTLTEQVWNIHFETDTNVVDVGIRRLRQKVDGPFSIKIIHTIRGIGYVCRVSEGTTT